MWVFAAFGSAGFTTIDLEWYGERRWRPWRYDSSGVRGLSGGLNWAVDKSVCGSSCPQLRDVLATVVQVWAAHHPLISFNDVSDDCNASGVPVLAHIEEAFPMSDVHKNMPWTAQCPQAEIWIDLDRDAKITQFQLLTAILANYTDTSGRTPAGSEPELVASSITVPYDTAAEQGELPTTHLAQQIGHLLGLGHPNLARVAGLAAGHSVAGDNQYHTLLASGLGLNSSTCVVDPWSYVQSGRPDGSPVDPTACTNPADNSTYIGCIGVRPALMDHRRPYEFRSVPPCLEIDDVEGLYTLYPSCTMTSPLPPMLCLAPPTSPPLPSQPASADPEVILWEATSPGDLTTLLNDATAQEAIKDGIAASAGVDKEFVEVQYLPGSIKLFAVIGIPAGLTASTVAASVGASLGSPAAASAAIGIPVASVDAVSTTTTSAATNTVVSAGGAAFVAQWNQVVDSPVLPLPLLPISPPPSNPPLASPPYSPLSSTSAGGDSTYVAALVAGVLAILFAAMFHFARLRRFRGSPPSATDPRGQPRYSGRWRKRDENADGGGGGVEVGSVEVDEWPNEAPPSTSNASMASESAAAADDGEPRHYQHHYHRKQQEHHQYHQQQHQSQQQQQHQSQQHHHQQQQHQHQHQQQHHQQQQQHHQQAPANPAHTTVLPPHPPPPAGDLIMAVLAVPVLNDGQMSEHEALRILYLTDKKAKWLLSQVRVRVKVGVCHVTCTYACTRNDLA